LQKKLKKGQPNIMATEEEADVAAMLDLYK